MIWYGKLPWEQAWIVHRAGAPWGSLSALTIVLCFVVPFAGLLGRQPKLNPRTLSLFCGVILLGLWFERWMLVAPSLYREGDSIFPIWHPLIACLFAGLMLVSVRWALATFPAIQPLAAARADGVLRVGADPGPGAPRRDPTAVAPEQAEFGVE